MRVCQRGWEYAQITGEDGNIEICSWASMNYKPIGKLSENTMYEIWHGEEAEQFRKSLTDGSYRYCEKEKCPWMANGTLEDHMKEYDDALEYPVDVSLSYEKICNYTCTCCADMHDNRPQSDCVEKKLEKIENELSKFLDSVKIISAHGRGELFASKNILRVLQNWRPNSPDEEIEVILETNGSLFNEKNWSQIENLGKYNLKVSITVMGFDEPTYQFLSGTTLPIQRIIDNLHFVKSLRKKGIINTFEIGTVVQERNFREMPEFARKCIEEFEVDIVRLRPYFPFGDFDMGTKWLYDIRNPKHPYYSEYEKVLKAPIFKHEKVMMWSGEELSNMGANPYSKDKENFDVIKFFAVDEEIADKLKKYFEEKKYESVVVYGLGYTGGAFVNALIDAGIKIDAIIDKEKCGEVFKGYKLINLSEYKINTAVPIVVTSPFFYEEIKKAICAENDVVEVINIREIINEIEK